MLKWIAGGAFIAAQFVIGCAGQSGGYSPPSATPPPMATNAPPPAYSPPPAYAPPPSAYSPPSYAPAPAYSTQPYIYPARGQSPQQEESDKGQCYGWAVKQTGFDPANPRVVTPASPPSYSGQAPPQQGGVLFGGLRRLRFEEQEQQQMQMRQQQAYAAQQQNALAQGRANYERAFGACISGRGYSVR